jgi:hypothetical protein
MSSGISIKYLYYENKYVGTSSRKSFKRRLERVSRNVSSIFEDILAPRTRDICSNVASWVPGTVVGDGKQIFSAFQPPLE